MDKEHIFFENYAATWDTVRGENPPLLTRLVLFAGLARGVRVLDVGCGTGTLAPYLLRAVGEEGQVEELDYSHQMLLQAKKKLNRYKNVAYTEKNILKYRMADATYDAVVCLNFYPHITSSKETFVRKMAAALKPDGALIIMHDLPRMHVNNWNERQPDFDAGALPPVDIMTTLLITAGLTVTIAMDTDEFYFIKAVKQQRDHYEEYAEPDLSDEKAVSHLRSHLDGHIRGLAEHTHDEVEPHVHPHVHEHPHTEEHHHGHVHSHTQTKMVLNRLARIDTPYARIDANHRKEISEKFFPNISKQVIILSTDEEINEEFYTILKPYIAKEYLLTNDENQNRTTIEQHYFFGA